MNRRFARTTALVIAGATFLAPAAAGADPIIDAMVEGSPIWDGDTGALGQEIHITGTGCTGPGTTYMGEFVDLNADPLVSGGFKPFETTTTDGGFTWDTSISMSHDIGAFTARWYCAESSVESLDDPSILWVSPPVTITIADQMPAAVSRASAPAQTGGDSFLAKAVQKARTAIANHEADSEVGGTVVMGATATQPSKKDKDPRGKRDRRAEVPQVSGSSTQGVVFQTDPDDLPAIDRIDIPGEIAAKLKAKVDRKAPKVGRQEKIRKDNKAYVAAAFEVTTGDIPSNKVMRPYVERLDAGAYRVQIVEDIALTAHSAKWWNRHHG